MKIGDLVKANDSGVYKHSARLMKKGETGRVIDVKNRDEVHIVADVDGAILIRKMEFLDVIKEGILENYSIY